MITIWNIVDRLNLAISELTSHYRDWFYSDLEEHDIMPKASAWYVAAYSQGTGRLATGDKSTEQKAFSSGDEHYHFFSFPWVIYGILCELKNT